MGGIDPGGVLTCDQIILASQAGGAKYPEKDGSCSDGYRKIAVVLSDPKGRQWNDYHYYRQEKDGTWTHKPGYSQPTNLDAKGKPITDPETANRTYDSEDYSSFCGYLCVKK